MRHTLYLKLLVSYVIYGIFAFVIVCTFTQHVTVRNAEKNEAQALYRESAMIATNYATNYYYNSSFSVKDFQKNMKVIGEYLNAEIWIMDADGRVLFSTADDSIRQSAIDKEYRVIPEFDIADFGNSYYQVGRFYDQFQEDTLTVFSPVTVSFRNRAYIVIHKPVREILNTSDGYLNISFISVTLVFLCAFLILLAFTYWIYLPIRKITQAANSYAKGDFSAVIDVHANDEIGYLANTLNYMAQELDRLEEDQRKFVSNVSHDFRSPLTSIKGYVEAMLDGTIPVEMQEKYLNIILFETERLNKLTQSLIDLNQFGHHGIHLDLTDFDINQIIRTTILTFEGTCQKKGISFDLVLTGQTLLVHGDMSKIQQVLYNLIDNATKFSNPNSDIKIETHIKNDKVFVSVKDSGVGIPSESLKKIWERFYKIDASRGKDKKGTGLGLSIVKEIIQAHEEHINVISTEGVGTEFIFTLPLSHKEN